MANILNNFINSLRIRDEDDDEGYDEYVVEQENKQRKKSERPATPRRTPNRVNDDELERDEEILRNIQSKQQHTATVQPRPSIERLKSGNLVQFRTTSKGSEICIMKPKSFDDAMDICDMLMGNRATVINLEGFDVELAQRVVDFVCGAIYVQKGNLKQISEYILIVAPESFDISGDYLDIIAENGFEVPTFNKDF